MKNEHSLRVEAVVLRHADWGEADRLVTLFTRERGKVRAVAKGARKIKSRKAGHLEPFTRITVQLAVTRDLPIVTQVETLDAFLPLRDDLLKTGYAAYVLELLDRFTYEEEMESFAPYWLLVETLQRLSAGEDAWRSARYYEMRLLDWLGFRPLLFRCANCGEEIRSQDQFFSPARGGVVCPACGAGLPGLWTVSATELKYLRHFQRSSYAETARARPDDDIRRDVELLMQGYFSYLLERELNTPGFLRRIRR